jgi:methylphosphotriester-DNA--protein-cysteine methyltransferase
MFVGSKSSNKYHSCDCTWAKKISSKNLVCFKSTEEAQEKGYVPCKVCKPS